MAFLLAIVTFVSVMVAVLFIMMALVGTSAPEKIVARRLEAIEKATARGSESLELQLLRDELFSTVPALHRLLARWNWSQRLRALQEQAGMDVKPGQLVLWTGVCGTGAFVLARAVVGNSLVAFPVAVAAGAVPFGVVVFRRWRRLRAFEQNFPEAIDLLGRAVRAGHAFTTGMEMIGSELPEPVAGEFRKTFEEQNLGLPLKDALLNLTDRMPLLDVRFFVIALLIQKETGGNLAEILDNLARVIRERFKILGEVRIRTAQGRMTAGILIALPPIMMVLLGGMNPGYIRLLFTDAWGPHMLATAATLQIVGSAMLWKIVNIEV